jgi:hypothetical protein
MSMYGKYKCGHPKQLTDHGNRQRCPDCALEHKRDYNRERQQFLKVYGLQGIINHRILIALWDDSSNGKLETTYSHLNAKGFLFHIGTIRVICDIQERAYYKHQVQVGAFILLYNGINKEESILIIKSNNHDYKQNLLRILSNRNR